MQAALQALLELVHDQLHPSRLIKQPELSDGHHEVWQQAYREARQWRSKFLAAAASSPHEEGISVLVRTSQIGLSSLLKKVGSYMQPKIAGESTREPVVSAMYEKLCAIIVSQLKFLVQHFPGMVDGCQCIDGYFAKTVLQDFIQRLQFVKPAADALTSLVLRTLSVFTAGLGEQKYRLRDVIYHELLLQQLECSSNSTDTPSTGDRLKEALLYFNFNHSDFISYLLEEQRQLANNYTSTEEQKSHWLYFRNCITARCYHDARFDVQQAAIKDLLQVRTGFEIGRINSMEKKGSDTGRVPIKTSLSAGQLALLFHLLIREEVIHVENVTSFLSQIAGYVYTTRSQQLSADSLRAKFYSHDAAAIKIVRERLLRMVQLLKTA